MTKVLLSDTTMVGDWPDENCDRCGEKGAQIIHWGSLADRTATMFCRKCWHKVAERYHKGKLN